MTEMREPVRLSPLNPAPAVAFIDGAVSVPDRETFRDLSYQGLDVRADVHLQDLEFVKFYIVEADTDRPQVYFMNTNTHRTHGSFRNAVNLRGGRGAPADGNAGGDAGGGGRVRGANEAGNVPGEMRGEIIYHPYVNAPNGDTGLYRFEFEPRDAYPFAAVQMAYELLAANMPVLRNNFAYYPMPEAALPRYWQEKNLYDASRVMILLEEDIYANVRNTQIGEDLVTNPEALSIPEEILLPARGRGYTLVRPSNLVPAGELILSQTHLSELRSYLGTIHRAFHGLYNIRRGSDFAMEIEYKITREDTLAIKQARPWVD